MTISRPTPGLSTYPRILSEALGVVVAAGTPVAGEPTGKADEAEADWAAGSGTNAVPDGTGVAGLDPDRKSTRLNSSHLVISYAVFCLKKKKTQSEHNI